MKRSTWYGGENGVCRPCFSCKALTLVSGVVTVCRFAAQSDLLTLGTFYKRCAKGVNSVLGVVVYYMRYTIVLSRAQLCSIIPYRDILICEGMCVTKTMAPT